MSLARKAVGATFWVAVTTYASQFVAFFANVALMRLIAPEAFGVLALAVFFATLGRKLVGFGFNHALVHRQEELPAAAGTHLLLHLTSAALVIALAAICYPLVAVHYDGITALVLVIVAVGAAFESAGYTPRIMLEKRVEFRNLQLLNLGVTVGVNAAAVLAALLWPNVWVLALRLVAAQLTGAIGYWRLNRGMKLARPSLRLARWYLSFGAPLWVAGLATFAVLQFDDFLVGTLIDKETLGFYARAYALAVLPTTMITHIVARVAFPIYANVQHDGEKLTEAFGTVLRMIVLLSAPAAVGLAYVAPEFVLVVFGAKWLPMVPLVRWLMLYELLRPIFDDVGELFTAIGHPRKISRIQIAQAAAVIVITPPLVWGLEAVGAAIAVGLVMLLGVVLAYRSLRPHVNIDAARLIVVPIVCCLAAGGVAWGVLYVWPVDDVVWRLLAKAALFTGAAAALLLLAQGRALRDDYRRLRERLKGASPS
ncbi:MAG: oligosaccharide flippase family protein [Candidatus Lernaella stagnicola]|nr:oligosaccharide flippase family protein [Candidatus Lernaella stagnicola]